MCAGPFEEYPPDIGPISPCTENCTGVIVMPLSKEKPCPIPNPAQGYCPCGGCMPLMEGGAVPDFDPMLTPYMAKIEFTSKKMDVCCSVCLFSYG